MNKNMVITKETVVANTTTETEVFSVNLGSIRDQKMIRFKTFFVVDNNAALTDTILLLLYINGTYVTNGVGTPDVGSPFMCSVQDVLFQDSGNQLANTILLNGQSQNGDTDDGASHLHLNQTTVDTSDDTVVSIRVVMGAANPLFGVTAKVLSVEHIL